MASEKSEAAVFLFFYFIFFSKAAASEVGFPSGSDFPAGFGSLSRSDFPAGFVFGVGSSAFQYEGAVDVDGRGQSNWDTFIKENHPAIIEADGLNAIDHYRRYKDDVKLIKEMGWDSYRFSIAWSRLLPGGRRTMGPKGEELGVNKLGVEFYNSLIDELLANGIEPVGTIYHWDHPDNLETEYLGFLSEKIVPDFVDYADLCFREFGDRVKTWITLNEPFSSSFGGYSMGTMAPGRGETSDVVRKALKGLVPGTIATSDYEIDNSPTPKVGDPSTEPYIVGHFQLLAHAAVFKLYKQKYQKIQNGKIGISLNAMWAEPYSDTRRDKYASRRSIDFMFGWYMDPVTYGRYPESMRRIIGPRLPEFTEEQSKDLAGSFDFLGLNYYTARYVKDNRLYRGTWYNSESQVISLTERDGVPIGEQAFSDWLYIYPQGILKILLYIKELYNNPIVYITENGVDEAKDDRLRLSLALNDTHRISYHHSHLSYLKKAIEEGVNVERYYAWSLFDNLEWAEGFHSRFGINFIDFNANLKRVPKISSGWFKHLLQK